MTSYFDDEKDQPGHDTSLGSTEYNLESFDEFSSDSQESLFEDAQAVEVSLTSYHSHSDSHEGDEFKLPLQAGGDDLDQPISLDDAKDLESEGAVQDAGSLEALDLSALVEAILFASPKPLKVGDILEILADESVTSKEVSEVISSLVRFYRSRKGGFKLENVRHGYQFQTDPAAGEVMERMFSSRPRPISRAAQETLAIIAYRQPVTRADIEFIRGVDAGSIMKNLLDRNLIKCVGRKEDSGRPMLFGTTEEFLQVYALSSLGDLPPLEAFQPSHEIMKNALEAIDQGEEQEGPADFVGNYDEQAEQIGDSDDLTGESWDEDDLTASAMTSEAIPRAIAHDKPPQPMVKDQSPPETERVLRGPTKAKSDDEARPQGIFLGDLDGGFEDDDNSEEKY